jgi:hypothetical protein
MTIEPDTKDWTWVLQRPCPECGLDTRDIDRDQIGAMVRANAASWQSLLAWQRTGSRSDGAHFTIESFARYFVHDPIHHLHDVTGARAGRTPRLRPGRCRGGSRGSR